MVLLTPSEIVELYRKRARNYDLTANLYYLIGFRERAYRDRVVDALNLKQGDTVVELCCGTGLNFSLLEKAVGPEGRIIGVDATDAMIEQARKRIERKGWKNIVLVHSDVAEYQFPKNIDGVLSTFGITLVPDYDQIIKRGEEALRPGKRLAVLDLKLAPNWPSIFISLGICLSRPFGVSREMGERHPWRSIEKYFRESTMTELYGGLAYIATGEK